MSTSVARIFAAGISAAHIVVRNSRSTLIEIFRLESPLGGYRLSTRGRRARDNSDETKSSRQAQSRTHLQCELSSALAVTTYKWSAR